MGLDVGGTKVEGAVAIIDTEDHSIEVLAKSRIPLPGNDSETFTSSLSDLIESLIHDARINQSDLVAIGMGLPGSIDQQTNRMINGNTYFLIGEDLKNKLQSKLPFSIPLFVENDANLFTLAESWGGAGKTFYKKTGIPFHRQVVIGITLGTGVGGGFVTNGSIFSGAHGGGLEVGHISLDAQGRKCYCSQFGCAETYLSGTALQKNRHDWSSKEIFEKYRNEDINAEKILRDYREKMLHFLRTLTNLFNPHYIVFGGGLSNQPDLFVDLETELSSGIFLGEKYAPKIYVNELGDSAGVYGAMIHAMNKLQFSDQYL